METIILIASFFPKGRSSDLSFGNAVSGVVLAKSCADAGAEWGQRGHEQTHHLPTTNPDSFSI